MRTVSVFGSTGSIGTQTLELIGPNSTDFKISVLSANSNWELLAHQAKEFSPEYVVIGDASKAEQLKAELPDKTQLVVGYDSLAELSGIADISVNGVVGFAGLPVTVGCLKAGKRLALANKESLIAAGPLVQQVRKTKGAELLPVDSEHAAVHQCLHANTNSLRVKRLQITASGGPFRNHSAKQLNDITIDEALNHPTWTMGPKITIDSSTLMNKGLEVIEANELFGKPAGDLGYGLDILDIEVVVHPQSIVHSMVTYSDGSTIAQLSNPDMRLPIGYALSYPDRYHAPYGEIDWSKALTLEFEPPKLDLFPCLKMAFEAAEVGGAAPAWLNAANEVAVSAFLKGELPWKGISVIIEKVLVKYSGESADSLESVLSADTEARKLAEVACSELGR